MVEDMSPKLRPADNRDCERVAALVFGVLREYNLKPDPDCTDADLKDIQNSYFDRGGAFYVLEDKSGSVIGAYGLYPAERTTCELRKMYLQKSFRGNGLGKLLLEDALANARRMGFVRMTLETASVLVEAIGLYRSYGFVEYKPEHLSARCDQAFVLELK
ncbi:MAG: GNAT family N-acetyltransferase [Planctomycetota bacterium]